MEAPRSQDARLRRRGAALLGGDGQGVRGGLRGRGQERGPGADEGWGGVEGVQDRGRGGGEAHQARAGECGDARGAAGVRGAEPALCASGGGRSVCNRGRGGDAAAARGAVIPVETLDYAVWPMLHRMTQRGLLVDQGALDVLQRKATTRMFEVIAELEQIVGHPINPNSGVQVAEWMEEEGITGKLTRGRDRLSTAERDLKLHVSPVIDLTLEYRGLQKVVSSYIEPTRGYSRFDGRVHPRWKPTRVPSGRLACGRERASKTFEQWGSPNLMAFPARDDWGRALRACFVADSGYTMF